MTGSAEKRAARRGRRGTAKPTNGNGSGHVDWLVPVSDSMVFLEGWLSAVGPEARAELVSPAGGRVELSRSWRRYRRPDVEKMLGAPKPGVEAGAHGFACLARLQGADRASAAGSYVEVRGEGGTAEYALPAPLTDPALGRKRVLERLGMDTSDRTFLAEKVHPAVEALTRRIVDRARVDRIIDRGSLPAAPIASIVIPLYGRLDFLVHQLGQFAADPELAQAELIFVLDSPELASQLEEASAHLHALYGVPMRIVFLTRNGGYGQANNLGVEQARAPYVLLLNSDVFPDRPGWLGRMIEFHRSQSQVGAVGPKLLYEDRALQHAGLYFERDPVTDLWQNLHYFKGFPAEFRPSNVARAVPAVTGACMLMERDRFQELGGLSISYVQGDYEDSDLCLRLRERGLDILYTPEPRLFHLERQSYRPVFKTHAGRGATVYNRWLHTLLWDERIEALMREFEAVPEFGD
jgi:GT2 family glycosyltransferase